MTTGSSIVSDATHIILDRSRPGDDFSVHLSALTAALKESGARVRVFPLAEMKRGQCIGCFDCRLKTPGQCVHSDAGADLAASVLRSRVTVFFSPVVFRGYSPELKVAIDRCFSSLLLPDAGEAICGGEPLAAIRRRVPSVAHVKRALDLAAAALATGAPVPEDAVRLIAATPIPLAPFSAWRAILNAEAAARWERKARENGVTREALRSQPLRSPA